MWATKSSFILAAPAVAGASETRTIAELDTQFRPGDARWRPDVRQLGESHGKWEQQSLFLDGDVAKHGGFAVDCDHGGGHVSAPDDRKIAGWQFLKDHPFGVSPEPYANGLPSGFPRYCKIITAANAIPNPDPLDMPRRGLLTAIFMQATVARGG